MAISRGVMATIIIPIVAFIIFMLPVIEAALQIELESTSFPIHWRLVISAAIGGAMATIVSILRKIFTNYQKELDQELNDLRNQIKILGLERDITERDLMLNSACLNSDWIAKNMSIQELEDVLRKKEELIK